MSVKHQSLAFQEAATLALIEAVKFGQQLEFFLARQIMEDCNAASSRLQYVILSTSCQTGRFADAVLALETYSQQADLHVYHTVLASSACTELVGVPLPEHPL